MSCVYYSGEDAVEEPAYPPEFGDVDQEAHHHFKDPKKTLRGFFEREGNREPKKFVCVLFFKGGGGGGSLKT